MTKQKDDRRPVSREERRRVMVELLEGPGLRPMILAVVSLAVGAIIAIAARGFVLTDQLIGYAVVGLLLLAPVPMLAGDATDALLIQAVRRRAMSADAYQRTAVTAVSAVVVVVGMLVYPVVLTIGGVDLLGIAVIAGAFVLFGVLPVASWIAGKLRRRREEP